MNILYIGPYRQQDVNGLTSMQILSHLIKNKLHKVKCAPIYLDPISIESEIPDNILNAEKRSLDNYDIVVQYAHMDQLVKIDKISKNIAMPIISCNNIKESELEQLQRFDSILVDTKLAYNRLVRHHKLRNKVHTFSYEISSLDKQITKSTYNIGVLQYTTKMYFIGNYSKNITNIINLCKAFVTNIKSKEYSLILYVYGLDFSTKNNLENLIKQLYINNNLQYTINRILVVPIEYTLTHLVRAHNTGDIFVDLQDDNSNSFNVKIAKYFNKTIVQYKVEDLAFQFDRNNSTSLYGFEGVSEYHINSSMKNIIHGTNSYDELPFKQKDLIELL